MTEVEKFLSSQQRFECVRLSANLTVAQCEANRKRLTNHYTGTMEVFQCQDCAGLGKAVELKERIDMAREEICKHCKKSGKIHGRGLDQACYNELKKAGTLDDLYPMVGRNPHDHGAVNGQKKEPAPAAPPLSSNVKSNPLLKQVSKDKQIMLDLFDKHDLWNWLQENEITAENIIELIDCTRIQGPMKVVRS